MYMGERVERERKGEGNKKPIEEFVIVWRQ
jgi:hypothetical protein